MKISLILQLSSITVLVVFLISSNISPVYGHCLRDQKALLLKLKNRLTFDSSLSTKLDRWDQNTDCCQWPGINCDQKGHVLVLELDNETISGGVENSSSLFDLKYLEKLNLAYNQLDAVQIPIEIYKLKNLTYLNFSYAGFDGQIPTELSRLTQLVFLDLSYNYFLKLESPDLKTLVENLTNLEELYLDDVNIYMNGTECCWALSSSLLKLRVLSMTRCGISGPLDPLLLKLHFLAVIRLDHNDMSTIDLELLANFTKLTTLSLMSCNLRGSFPSKIIQVPTLQVLDLSYNENLVGDLPEFPQKSAVRELVLSHTGFTGSLPNSIANLRNMARLVLRSCNFNGHIPSNLGNLTDLIHLDLSFNNFTGSIPLFHKAKKLKHIDLSNNIGPISSAQTQLSVLLSLPSLQFLSIQNSQLRGEVHEFSNASSSVLETLDLSNNHLNGSIPRSIFKLKRLSELSLSSNSFSGTINIEAMKGLPKLTTLDLSYNNLRIDIHDSNSTSFGFPVEISNLRLASCQLQKFPDLKNQSLLFYLDLSDNKIRGEIPSWVWKVGYLNLSHNFLESVEKPYHISTTPSVVDLSFNRIKGNLPFLRADTDRFANWTSSITYLSLANNKLIGSIPSSICNLDELQFLDMSNNSINRKIPPCLFQKLADRLVVLNIGRNKLSGIIPDTFPLNCNLRTLDLSNNILEGKFPRSLKRCEFLEVLNIGNNMIRSKFPCMLKKFSNLHVLVLRSNKFHGNLQCPIANQTWSTLQIVDLASNNFSGALLPQYFSNLEGMTRSSMHPEPERQYLDVKYSNIYYQVRVTLTFKGLSMETVKILVVFTSIDFSCNNFQGEIPEILGNLKSLHHLNFSHNALTGRIPKSIGKLTQLESLDLSVNRLSGRIPEELVGLTFLSVLNLSFNQLSGRIPKGNQFQTFSADSFEGNAGLCDFPLKKTCSDTKVLNELPQPSSHSDHEKVDEKYISFALGSSVSFGIVIWLLLHSQRYNELADRLLFRILCQHKKSGMNKSRRRSR